MRVLALCVVLAACGSEAGSESLPAATTSSEPTETTTGPTDTTPSTSPETSADVACPPSQAPLRLTLSVHVERHDDETRDRAEFDLHLSYLDRLADLADQYGVVVSFELSNSFVEALDGWDSSFVRDMTARCHGVAQHSGDQSTDGLEGADRTAELARQKAAIEAYGVEVVYLSGACSEGSWVESAIEAGFVAASGNTEFCLRSIDEGLQPEGMEWINACENPAICHDPLQIDAAHVLHPWTTSGSNDWLRDEPGGGLVIIAGDDTLGLAGMSMDDDPDPDAARADWQAMLDEYTAAVDPERLNVLNVTVSIGPEPDWEVLEATFAEVAARDGVGWARLADAATAASEESSRPVDDAPTYTDTAPDAGGSPGSGTPSGTRPPGGSLPSRP